MTAIGIERAVGRAQGNILTVLLVSQTDVFATSELAFIRLTNGCLGRYGLPTGMGFPETADPADDPYRELRR